MKSNHSGSSLHTPSLPPPRQRPFNFAKIAAIASLSLGLALGSLLGPVEVLCFKGASVTCQVSRQVALGLVKTQTREVTSVEKVQVEQRSQLVGSDVENAPAKRVTMYGVMIIGAEKKLLVDGYHENAEAADAVVGQINQLIEGNQKEISVVVRNIWLDILTVGCLAIGGSLLWLSIQGRTEKQ